MTGMRGKTFFEFWDYVCISMGMAVATSCFAIFPLLFQTRTLQEVMMSIGLAGFLAVLLSLVWAEWAHRFPSGPGMLFYIRKAFSVKVMHVVSVILLLIVGLLAGVECSFFAHLCRVLFPSWNDLSIFLFSHSILVVVLLSNFWGGSRSKKIQTLSSSLMLVGWMALSFGALWFVSSTPQHDPSILMKPQNQPWNIPLILEGVGISFFFFIGLEWVTPMGKNPESYRRLLPLSIPAAAILVCLMYGLLAYALGSVFSQDEITTLLLPHVSLGQRLWPSWGTYVVLPLSALAFFTSYNAGLMGAGRMLYALAREGLCPKTFATLDKRGRPQVAILSVGFSTMLISFFVYLKNTQQMAMMIGATGELVLYTLIILGLWNIRQKEKKSPPKNNNKKTAYYFFPHWSLWGLVLIFLGLAFMTAKSFFDTRFL
jgi:amino acid transporter